MGCVVLYQIMAELSVTILTKGPSYIAGTTSKGPVPFNEITPSNKITPLSSANL